MAAETAAEKVARGVFDGLRSLPAQQYLPLPVRTQPAERFAGDGALQRTTADGADAPPPVLLHGAWRVVWDPGGMWLQPLTPRETALSFGPGIPSGSGSRGVPALPPSS